MKVNSTNPESFHSNKALTIDIKKPWISNHNLGKNETLLKITAWSVYIQSWKSEIPTWMLLSIHLQWDQPWAHHIQASAGKDPLKIDVTFNQWRGCRKETCWVFSFLGSRQRLWWPLGCNRLCEFQFANHMSELHENGWNDFIKRFFHTDYLTYQHYSHISTTVAILLSFADDHNQNQLEVESWRDDQIYPV